MPLKSWLNIPSGSHFSIANIPFGIISYESAKTPRPAIAIGAYALDLQEFTSGSGFRDLSIIQPHSHVFSEPTLNAFAGLGRPMHAVVRKYLQSVFLEDTPYPEVLKNNQALQGQCLLPRAQVTMHLPMRIGDYTDFFAGMHHATNAGKLFRGPQNALQPNYKHLPVAYHGRASSVVVSKTPVRRPRGQILEDPTASIKKPIFSACRKLDFELELGVFLCKSSTMGDPISTHDAQDFIFGCVLLNDWSARDIQAWEYVPLGPFLAKNFATSISPWVVLADALEPFRAAGIESDTDLLPYLREEQVDSFYDIHLEVDLTPASGESTTICRTSSTNLLFSFPQMLAHHTITGCPMAVGDLLGSGTISGTSEDSWGSLLEQSSNGTVAVKLNRGDERTFLRDGDTIAFRGVCGTDPEALVGFGECTGTIIPALE